MVFLLPLLLLQACSAHTSQDGHYEEARSGWYTDRISQGTAFVFDKRRDRHDKGTGCYWEIHEGYVKDRHYPGRVFKRRKTRPIKPCER